MSPLTRENALGKEGRAGSVRSRLTPAAGARRKNSRLLNTLISHRQSYVEAYFESISPEEAIQVFEESYCSSLVNALLDLKKSTTKRLFEIVAHARKRAFFNVFALYYYKEYLTNPLPLTLESESGKHVPNYYAILGVPREASIEELKASHKLMAASLNAESFPPAERKAGEERWREIDEAFEILKNPKRRKVLDETLPNISYFYPRRDQSWFSAVNRLVS